MPLPELARLAGLLVLGLLIVCNLRILVELILHGEQRIGEHRTRQP